MDREKKLKFLGEGPWIDEPDQLYFEHLGFECRIIRRIIKEIHFPEEAYFGGYLCGYIKIPENHPWYGENNDQIDLEEGVHYGLTYSKVEDSGYWIGFDCAHSGDIVPSMDHLRKTDPYFIKVKESEEKFLKPFKEKHPDSPLWNSSYKTIDYVKKECESLAEQAAKANKNRETLEG